MDSERRVLKQTDVLELAHELGVDSYETSLKNNTGVKQWLEPLIL
jgi:hypothetical protein